MKAVVFDLGGVVVEWNPRRLLTDDFIEEIDFFNWNVELDRGAPFADAIAGLQRAYPHRADLIDAFDKRWPETIGPVIPETIAVVDDLKNRGVAVFVLSNSSAETLPRSVLVQEVFELFDGVLLSGEVGLVKPDPAIFSAAEAKFGLDPSTTWFVDDNEANAHAATAAGWHGIHFTGPASLAPLADL